jgi:hypothetical protein
VQRFILIRPIKLELQFSCQKLPREFNYRAGRASDRGVVNILKWHGLGMPISDFVYHSNCLVSIAFYSLYYVSITKGFGVLVYLFNEHINVLFRVRQAPFSSLSLSLSLSLEFTTSMDRQTAAAI